MSYVPTLSDMTGQPQQVVPTSANNAQVQPQQAYQPKLSDMVGTSASVALDAPIKANWNTPLIAGMGGMNPKGIAGQVDMASMGFLNGGVQAASAVGDMANNVLHGLNKALLGDSDIVNKGLDSLHGLQQSIVNKAAAFTSPQTDFEKTAQQEYPSTAAAGQTAGYVGGLVTGGNALTKPLSLVTKPLAEAVPILSKSPTMVGMADSAAANAVVGAAANPDHPLTGAVMGGLAGAITHGVTSGAAYKMNRAGMIIDDELQNAKSIGLSAGDPVIIKNIKGALKADGTEIDTLKIKAAIQSAADERINTIRPDAFVPNEAPANTLARLASQRLPEEIQTSKQLYQPINDNQTPLDTPKYTAALAAIPKKTLDQGVHMPDSLSLSESNDLKNSLGISAEKSNLSRTENIQRTNQLKLLLQKANIPFKSVNGYYEGVKEKSFNIPHTPQNETLVKQLQTKFQQDSYLHIDDTNTGLIKNNGNVEMSLGKIGISDTEPNTPGYSQINNKYYTNIQNPTLNQMLGQRLKLDGTLRQVKGLMNPLNAKLTSTEAQPIFDARAALNEDIHDGAAKVGLGSQLQQAEAHYNQTIRPNLVYNKSMNSLRQMTPDELNGKVWKTLTTELNKRFPDPNKIAQISKTLGTNGKELVGWAKIENDFKMSVVNDQFNPTTFGTRISKGVNNGLNDLIMTPEQKQVVVGLQNLGQAAKKMLPVGNVQQQGLMTRVIQHLTYSRGGIQILKILGSPSLTAKGIRHITQQVIEGSAAINASNMMNPSDYQSNN